MTEQELYEKIKKSAEEIEVPEGLSPEQIKEKLPAKRTGRSWATTVAITGAAAAAVALVCLFGASYLRSGLSNKQRDIASTGATASTDVEISTEADATESTTQSAKRTGARNNAGDLYVVAKDYGDVYDAIDSSYLLESSASAEPMKQESEDAVSYSQTNVQTEGVDESDIVKTDGSYLYVVKDSSVEILSAKEGELAHVCELTLTSSEADSAVERVQELYVEGDRLIAILECTQNTLTDPTGEEIETPVGNGILPLEQEDTESASTDMAIADVAYYAVKAFTTTELQTYDISDRAHPVKVGTVTQDGNYRESRKIGDVIYLFTMEGLTSPNLTREEALDEEDAGKWIPLINGEPVAACDIYLSERGSVGLAISSVDVTHPDDVVDETMIVYNGASLYISQSALYLYGIDYIDYTQELMITSIAKFSLTDGMIDAVGAAVVPGEVTDTFAVSEQQGNLCVLTSDRSSAEIENGLYVLDETLSRIGTLEHLAEGEMIYAARYIGNMAYFVTYRNTDPLFAVDLSDPTKPTVKSELTISGFSEYLHDWGTDDATGRSLLLGIGYETDAQTGVYRGIKLTMFDITDPSDPQIADTYVIKTANYSPALYFYKSVLAEPGEKLIGLVVTMQNAESFYQFYAWEDGAFVQKSSNSLGVTEGSEEFRGLYICDYVYVASSKGVTSYDRNDGYREVDKLDL